MPAQIQTYGKRTARQNSFVARCFAASSSPVKEELGPSDSNLGLSPAQSTRSKVLFRERSVDASDDVFWPAVCRSSEVDPLVELVENLGIRDDGEDSPSRLPRSKSTSPGESMSLRFSNALRDVDANSCAAKTDLNDREALKATNGKERKALRGRKLKTEGGRSRRDREKILDQHDVKGKGSPAIPLVDQVRSANLNGTNRTSPGSSHKRHGGGPAPQQVDPIPPISPTPTQNRACRTRTAHAAAPSTLSKHISTSLPPDLLADHARPLLNLCNEIYGRASPTPFVSWASHISEHLRITKIAEASYAEVYRLSLRDSTNTTLTANDESVLKIIPLKPPSELLNTLTKSQRSRVESTMSTVRDVAAEVTLLRHMSTVPGFANFRDVRVMVGRPPTGIVSAWRDWDKKNKEVKGEGSKFVDPGRKTSYAETQLWAVVEMQDAGRDLEGWCECQEYAATNAVAGANDNGSFTDNGNQGITSERIKAFRQVWGVWDAFWGVALSLAKGEEWAGFEHRDLHLGNICIRFPPASSQTDEFTIDMTKNINFTGVETTLIDYTLSRADLARHDQSSTSSSDARSDECGSTNSTEAPVVEANAHHNAEDIAFHDLSLDADVFAGDGADDYQYDIYRHMRGAVLFSDPNITEETPKPGRDSKKKGKKQVTLDLQNETSKWREYHPLTNLVWLHFVLYKLTELLLVEWPSSTACASSSSGKNGRRGGKRRGPAPQEEEQQIEERNKALELEGRLLELRDGVLDLERMKEGPEGVGSAAELVVWAVGRGWFGEDDVLDA